MAKKPTKTILDRMQGKPRSKRRTGYAAWYERLESDSPEVLAQVNAAIDAWNSAKEGDALKASYPSMVLLHEEIALDIKAVLGTAPAISQFRIYVNNRKKKHGE